MNTDHTLRMADQQPDGNKPKQNQAQEDERNLHERMSRVQHKILVLSGKGGVGKSTVAVNLAVTLALKGKKVGLMDIDIHGPSVPKMLNLSFGGMQAQNNAIIPMQYGENLKVMSMGLLMENEDQAVIWRGPLKMQIIKQFLKDVEWGDLDYLIVDSPPGTGDEPLSIAQLLADADGAVIVTTPQEVSVVDVRKCIYFTRKLNLKVLGVVENMSGFVCPSCGDHINIFRKGGGEKMATELNVPFLGSVPIEKEIVEASDEGKPYMQYFKETAAATEFNKIVERMIENTKSFAAPKKDEDAPLTANKRIAIPVSQGNLSAHFGHCESFALIDVDEKQKKIVNHMTIPSPGHQPGVLPRFLAGHNVNLILTGGMGVKAQQLFQQEGITVCLGVPEADPEKIVKDYLTGTLETGDNACDHGKDGHHHDCQHKH